MSERAADPRAAAQAFVRLALAFAGYLIFGTSTARWLGATGSDAPIEAQVLAHGAGCVALCAIGLLLPSRARLWPARGAIKAPAFYLAFLCVWVPLVLFGYTAVLERMHVPFPPQPHLAYFAGLSLQRWEVVAAVATVVVIGPLAEEIAFRGYARDLFAEAVGARAGLLLTALLFGVFHGLVFAFPLALLGLLFGWLRERYDSLAPAVVAHALHNGLTVSLVMTWPQIFDGVYR